MEYLITFTIVVIVVASLILRVRHNNREWLRRMEGRWEKDPDMIAVVKEYEEDEADAMTEEEWDDFTAEFAAHVYNEAVSIKAVSEKVE